MYIKYPLHASASCALYVRGRKILTSIVRLQGSIIRYSLVNLVWFLVPISFSNSHSSYLILSQSHKLILQNRQEKRKKKGVAIFQMLIGLKHRPCKTMSLPSFFLLSFTLFFLFILRIKTLFILRFCVMRFLHIFSR